MIRRFSAPDPPAVPQDGDRLQSLQREATDALIEAVHRGPEVRRIAEGSRAMRRTNGFEALIERSMYPR